MRTKDQQILNAAQELTARWGFLTRDLFFEFICKKSRAQNFQYWNWLAKSGYFVRSKAHPNVIFLSHKSRSVFGNTARLSRSHFFIEHDSIVAQILLTLCQSGLVSRSWLEHELMENRIEAYSVLGADKLFRVPDVVFDLKTDSGNLRLALEIEKTVKTNTRYDKMALAYSGYRNINLLLFACGNQAIESTIKRSFFKNQSHAPGLFLYSDFTNDRLKTSVRFNDKGLSLQTLLERLTQKSILSKQDVNKTAVLFRNSKNSEAA